MEADKEMKQGRTSAMTCRTIKEDGAEYLIVEHFNMPTDKFRLVDRVPQAGYYVWNIGQNMPDGYIPFCRLCMRQPFEGARNIERHSLLAVKAEGSREIMRVSHYFTLPASNMLQEAVSVLKAAEAGLDSESLELGEARRAYLKEKAERLRTAIPYMEKLPW